VSNKNLLELVLVVDRSGSVLRAHAPPNPLQTRKGSEGGINALIEEQQKQEGECNVTIVQFDQEYEFVCTGVPVKDVSPYVLEPRGMTALLDAVGRAVSETRERIKAMKKKERPGLVTFVIVTDGEENASCEFTNEGVSELIGRQRKKGWGFTFLGADEKAFAQARSMGMSRAATAQYDPKNVKNAYLNASRGITRGRTSRAGGQSLEASVDAIAFTDEERESMVDPQP